MVSFALSQVENNDEGWGPTTAPPQFANVPFMPFSKGDRLGRIADFGMPPGRAQYQSELLGCGHFCFAGPYDGLAAAPMAVRVAAVVLIGCW